MMRYTVHIHTACTCYGVGCEFCIYQGEDG